ncbi:hypothetical protein K2173_017398 [Erythroxylum novogranatense]|uniref:Carboxypeptidase n=1 Tax=Erythroxylum novogranatense TaxID=1862640 RepID=A0AAV8TN57_9ROSI|nr:hypothetical protein K2173_017398 [Erythroxylum novogranatense]
MTMTSVKRPLYLLSVCRLLFSLVFCIKALENIEDQEFDRVILLPGQPSSPAISQFSGYITVKQEHGRALFYWFFEAESEASKRPLLLWLNGGPGCSSIGYGAASELGPLRVAEDGASLTFNIYSWTKEANLLFVESPAGVGFSYSNTSSDLDVVDDEYVAEDAYSFLVGWFQRFPQYKTHDFFISGESYAGHYVPQLAELVYDRNKDAPKNEFINLKGFIVGNPETNDYYDDKGVLEYAWSHAVISDELYNKAKNVCDFRISKRSDDCNEAVNLVFRQYSEIDMYNIYAPACLINTTSSSLSSSSESQIQQANKNLLRRLRVPGGYDPCYSPHAEMYFNRANVQSALHANVIGNPDGKWKVCNDHIFSGYNYTSFSILPIYSKLIKAGFRIWIYSGDTDGRVPVIGSRYCVEALGLPTRSPWRSWSHERQVGGRVVEYEGLTFVTVRGAGHLVPLNKPSHALSLIHHYLSAQPLPPFPA